MTEGARQVKRFLEGKTIYLREVRLSDVNGNYYRWLNDPDVSQYLETRFIPQSMENIKKYVENLDGRKDEIFMAMCLLENDKHIGNIKLGPINWIHRSADISLVIGEKDYWGKGIATEAVSLVTRYAFEVLNMHKLRAGCYDGNKGSIKAFLKNGFEKEGVRKEERFVGDKWVDEILLGLTVHNFVKGNTLP
ncbi:GNAT family N-acetyltransferase [bacterium]|nr:GNAT family N-acetyltransferase [bacterium]